MRLITCFLLVSLWHTLSAAPLGCALQGSGQRTVLLFRIKANCGKSAIEEYNKAGSGQSKDVKENDVFRSPYLDDLSASIKKTGSKKIVVEMLDKKNQIVASAAFDVSRDVDKVTSQNWFTTDRLTNTYPYWIGSSSTNYVDFSILGHTDLKNIRRTFYIHHSHGSCETDDGVMGIGESSNDGCSWVTDGGKPPVLFYAKSRGAYKGNAASVVGYAESFKVYLSQ